MSDIHILSHHWSTEYGLRRYQAPAGYMYKIRAIRTVNFSAASNQLILTPTQVEEDALLELSEESIASWDAETAGVSDYMLFPEEGIRTKYLTLGWVATNNVIFSIYIYYQLVKVSEKELVLEFIKRGKNP